jgi:hypothetical protein
MAGKGIFAVGLLLSFALPQVTFSAIPDVYTNENFTTSEHDKPVSFSVDLLGNVEGVTATGKKFWQLNIENMFNIRLQKFIIDQAYFYVSDRGEIFAKTDLEALSIYLSKEA